MFDDVILDDPEALTAADPDAMLQAIATAGAQVRRALLQRTESPEPYEVLAADERPRAVVVAGMGGSGVSGDVLAAATVQRSPVPVIPVRGYTLPAWVGALDVVLAVSCSGRTEETLAIVDEAARRGCRLVAVGASGSPLAARAQQAGAVFISVDGGGRPPRANLWALATPVLLIADALGIADFPITVLHAIADALDEQAQACGPVTPFDQNPAKSLAYAMSGTLPLAWGTTPLMGVAAFRLSAQAAENADLPVIHGELSEPHHNQVVMFDGPLGAGRAERKVDDLFRDPADGDDAGLGLSLVLLRDEQEHPQVRRRAELSSTLAQARSIPVQALQQPGADPLERFARQVALVDFATAYLALGSGIDPTAIGPIMEIKDRIAP
jgi:glucose/mannose-6-phosphate isomerase